MAKRSLPSLKRIWGIPRLPARAADAHKGDFGRILAVGARNSILVEFEDGVRKFFWDVSQFNVSKEDGIISLTCLSSKFSEAHSELFSKFLEGAFGALGYDLDESDVSKGIIRLRFLKSKGE